MEERLREQFENLIGEYGTTKTLGRQIVTLSGFMAQDTITAPIAQQLANLSRQLVLQDMFDSLMQSLNNSTRALGGQRAAPRAEDAPCLALDLNRLIEQIETVRRDITASEPINYSELIAWLVQQARAQKILRSRGRR
ncbi:hypothetical protein [Azoarcus olearius]|uniref:Uncharacterized protein n=1 Tax=Azoarcus sp. (strain BH72) TaxID=418699 RepID=A1K8V7_AZOSB|nr:hypothetical protein [Azoarcus olearius]CAL95262.1 hypothetical protein predicted by Glimmer/Critica [Azoarcus olearius]